MKVYTSYYGMFNKVERLRKKYVEQKINLEHLPETHPFVLFDMYHAIAISRTIPFWWLGQTGLPRRRTYQLLAPPRAILENYKHSTDDEAEVEYIQRYCDRVLEQLDPTTVLQELLQGRETCVLLCFEKSGSFCHRNIVRNWLYDGTGVETEEFRFDMEHEE